jgi:hypothetical protein
VHAALPRLSVLEMKVSLPGDETLFEAADGESYVVISSKENSCPNLSLASVVQDLMAVGPENLRLCHLSAFPLFLVIIGKCVCAIAIWYGI